jgi:hypothetical protein
MIYARETGDRGLDVVTYLPMHSSHMKTAYLP